MRDGWFSSARGTSSSELPASSRPVSSYSSACPPGCLIAVATMGNVGGASVVVSLKEVTAASSAITMLKHTTTKRPLTRLGSAVLVGALAAILTTPWAAGSTDEFIAGSGNAYAQVMRL